MKGQPRAEETDMTELLDQFQNPVGWLVLAGAALQAAACVFTNQVVLRVMLFAGSVHYLAYYTVAAETPLWPAIVGTSEISLANAIGFLRVLNKRHREKRKSMPLRDRLLYSNAADFGFDVISLHRD